MPLSQIRMAAGSNSPKTRLKPDPCNFEAKNQGKIWKLLAMTAAEHDRASRRSGGWTADGLG
ncbi:MAG: hypothetical protein LBT47_06515 [Deltaproteobacteria bacterium]|nr:hypothetical protein [Deltaproteobacteria bacterium]